MGIHTYVGKDPQNHAGLIFFFDKNWQNVELTENFKHQLP